MARFKADFNCTIKLRNTLVPKLQLGNPGGEAPASRDGELELPTLSSQAGAWELAPKSVQDRYSDLDVGRNKTARRQPGWAFPAIGAPEKLPLLGNCSLRCSTSCITHKDVGNADFAWSKISAHAVVLTLLTYIHVGNASLRLTRGQAYSGLRRDVYNDERGAWKRGGDLTAVTQRMGTRQI
ncbi:MAG: hypothetical protein ACXW01_12505 [Methylobacter sp.]